MNRYSVSITGTRLTATEWEINTILESVPAENDVEAIEKVTKIFKIKYPKSNPAIILSEQHFTN